LGVCPCGWANNLSKNFELQLIVLEKIKKGALLEEGMME
jgi:hypothetical protein